MKRISKISGNSEDYISSVTLFFQLIIFIIISSSDKHALLLIKQM